MNHNFLSFEITKMLPEENPYSNIDKWVEIEDDDNDSISYVLESEIEDEDCCGTTIKDVWTILDALTWLELQNYNVNVSCFNNNNKVWYFDFRTPETSVLIKSYLIGLESFKSRIEAYTAGIEYCLNLINSKNEL